MYITKLFGLKDYQNTDFFFTMVLFMLIAAGFTEIYTDTLISRIFFKRNWTFEYLPKDQMTLLKEI